MFSCMEESVELNPQIWDQIPVTYFSFLNMIVRPIYRDPYLSIVLVHNLASVEIAELNLLTRTQHYHYRPGIYRDHL